MWLHFPDLMVNPHIADHGNRACWKEGGRQNCARSDNWYRAAAGDAHNLFLSIGEVNSDRSNYRFSQWTPSRVEQKTYGKCAMAVDFKRRQAMPPEAARGVVSRAYLHMSREHNIRLSSSQRRLFEAWNRTYPADEVECKREKLVAEFQGYRNQFVVESCMH